MIFEDLQVSCSVCHFSDIILYNPLSISGDALWSLFYKGEEAGDPERLSKMTQIND